MSNVIDFLERVGHDARLRYASATELELALDGERLDPEMREAILARDFSAFDRLRGDGQVCCLLLPAEEEEGENEREDENTPSREEEESRARTVRPIAALRT